jgi:flagellin
MPIDSITLNSVTRTGLNALKRADEQSAQHQGSLSSGQRVNSIRDDAVAFAAAKALTDRAGDLATFKDRSSAGISTIGAALDGAGTVEPLLGQLRGIAQAARASETATERAAFADQFNAVRNQIDQVVGDSSYQGANLLSAGSSLTAGDVTVTARDSSTAGLGLAAAPTGGAGFTDAAIETALAQIDAASAQVRATQASLGSSIAALTIQADNAQQLRGIAAEGGLRLTEADLNEDAAGVTAAATRQQLSRVALTIGRDQQTSILSLF